MMGRYSSIICIVLMNWNAVRTGGSHVPWRMVTLHKLLPGAQPQHRSLSGVSTCSFLWSLVPSIFVETGEDAGGFKSRIRPPYPQRVVKGDYLGGVSKSPHEKVGPVGPTSSSVRLHIFVPSHI